MNTFENSSDSLPGQDSNAEIAPAPKKQEQAAATFEAARSAYDIAERNFREAQDELTSRPEEKRSLLESKLTFQKSSLELLRARLGVLRASEPARLLRSGTMSNPEIPVINPEMKSLEDSIFQAVEAVGVTESEIRMLSFPTTSQ